MIPIDVDPAMFRAAGGALDRAVDDLDAAVDRFESALEALGECWGGDDIGTLIGLCYRPAYETALACLDNNLNELATYGGKLALMADSYESVEADNHSELSRVESMLGTPTRWT
jgi:hypothetical protein